MDGSAPTAMQASAGAFGFDSAGFRSALSQFATGVTIVTTRHPDGGLLGLTVNSFSSVSLQPPRVLWSLACGARSLPAFVACSHYVVNVLAADQAPLAMRFSQRVDDRFAGIGVDVAATGFPVLDGAAAWFKCRNVSRYPEGDHIIFVGEVERCHVGARPALLFYAGRFLGLDAAPHASAGARHVPHA